MQVPKGLIVVAPGDLKSSPGGSEAASQPGRWEYDIPHPVPARSVALAIGCFSLFADDRPPAMLGRAAEFLIPAEDIAGVLVFCMFAPEPSAWDKRSATLSCVFEAAGTLLQMHRGILFFLFSLSAASDLVRWTLLWCTWMAWGVGLRQLFVLPVACACCCLSPSAPLLTELV